MVLIDFRYIICEIVRGCVVSHNTKGHQVVGNCERMAIENITKAPPSAPARSIHELRDAWFSVPVLKISMRLLPRETAAVPTHPETDPAVPNPPNCENLIVRSQAEYRKPVVILGNSYGWG